MPIDRADQRRGPNSLVLLDIAHGETFADVEAGEFVLVEDSYQYLSLAINNGDAGAKLRASAGSTVIIGPLNS